MVRQSFSRGVVTSELEQEPEPPRFGTRIQFWPDPEIFGAFTWDSCAIQRRLQQLVALRSQLACRFVAAPQWFPASLDLTSLLPKITWGSALHGPAMCCGLTREHTTARVALRWYARYSWPQEPVRSFCNMVETHEGKHLQGFERGVGRVIAAAARQRFGSAWRKAYDHVAPYLAAVVAVEILDPKWLSPVKDSPTNPELAEIVEAAIMTELPVWFEHHPQVLAALLDH